MKKTIRTFIKSSMVMVALFSFVVAGAVVAGEVAYADNVGQVRDGVEAIGGNNPGNRPGDLGNLIENIINLLLFAIGVIAVIMIIIGGIRYTTSNGDQSQVSGAKNTILYSIVGLVVAIMAYAIVNFVLRAL